MKLAAQLAPFIVFASLGKVGATLACLAMQLTVIGWVPAAAWALREVEDRQDEARLQRAMNERKWHANFKR